jgi:hypothetical protein
MTSAMVAFGIAVCGTSLICYMLMTRVQTRRANRRPSCGGSLPDGSSFAGGDSGNLLWFGGHHSASDHSGASHDCGGGGGGGGGGDSGGGGDGGGGGD